MTAIADPAGTEAWPPAHYAAADVEISVVQQSGRSPARTEVRLRGDGTGTLNTGTTSKSLLISNEEFVALVNDFYRIRFFDLPPDMTVQRSVAKGPDGALISRTLRLSDTGSTSVCFAVKAWKACVVYTAQAPAELVALAKRIATDAERR